jgi:hypothetical protein
MNIAKAAGLALASVVGLGLFSGAASAATVINFGIPGSFTGAGSSTGSFSQDGITGTVTAGGGCFFCSPVITQHATQGLGVSSHIFDDPALDGALTWESLSFAFSSTVKLVSIEFGWMDNEDDWTLSVGGGTLTASGDTATYNFGADTTASLLKVFAFDAFEQTGCGFSLFGHCIVPRGGPDDFWVKNITVEAVSPPAAVPLPAALPLFASAVAGMGLLGWRRRRRAA